MFMLMVGVYSLSACSSEQWGEASETKSNLPLYDEIFKSNEYLSDHKNMDLEITAIRNGKIVFSHEETGYETEYMVEENAYPYLFNTDGTSKGTPNFAVGTFKSVKAIDIDYNGLEELVMRQYVSIGWNANYIGDCISVWKIMNDELTLVSVTISIN